MNKLFQITPKSDLNQLNLVIEESQMVAERSRKEQDHILGRFLIA